MKTEEFLKLYAKASGWESDVTIDNDLVPEYPCVKYTFGDISVLSICEEFAEYAEKLSPDMELEQVLALFYDLEQHSLMREKVLGFYADDCISGEDLPEISDENALNEFLNALPYEDAARGEVSVEDDFSCCMMREGKIIGAAGAVYDGVLADVSVSVLPEYRGQGIAKRLVAALCKKVQEKGIVPVYRVEESNAPSVRVAQSLGLTLGFIMEGAQVLCGHE